MKEPGALAKPFVRYRTMAGGCLALLIQEGSFPPGASSVHGKQHGGHTYRLVLVEDSRGCARTIEFEAEDAEAALLLARKECTGREVELFEDGRILGRLKHDAAADFWVILPAGKAAPTDT